MVKIEIKNMDFKYENGPTVLNDIDLTIDEPGLYCIMGPNGVGKSTLVKCICKINTHTSGEVLIDGTDIRKMTYKDISKKVGFVPACSFDAFSTSVVDAIKIGRYKKHRWGSDEEDIYSVYKAMKLLRIEDLADKRSNKLSAGQYQKVSLARGLVQEPEVLILDEPTANLDVQFQVYVTEMLRAVARKRDMIVLMISHDLNITAKYADKIIMMARPGRIYCTGTPDEVIIDKNVEEVYSIRCKVIRDRDMDIPVVVLGEAIVD